MKTDTEEYLLEELPGDTVAVAEAIPLAADEMLIKSAHRLVDSHYSKGDVLFLRGVKFRSRLYMIKKKESSVLVFFRRKQKDLVVFNTTLSFRVIPTIPVLSNIPLSLDKIKYRIVLPEFAIVRPTDKQVRKFTKNTVNATRKNTVLMTLGEDNKDVLAVINPKNIKKAKIFFTRYGNETEAIEKNANELWPVYPFLALTDSIRSWLSDDFNIGKESPFRIPTIPDKESTTTSFTNDVNRILYHTVNAYCEAVNNLDQYASGWSNPNLRITQSEKGISSTISISKTGKVKRLVIGVDISHETIENLIVELIAPSGKRITLHDQTSGSGRDLLKSYDSSSLFKTLLGQPIKGDWGLSVIDSRKGKRGNLKSWSIDISMGSHLKGLLGELQTDYGISDYESQIVLRLDKDGQLAMGDDKNDLFQLLMWVTLGRYGQETMARISIGPPDFLVSGALHKAFLKTLTDTDGKLLKKLANELGMENESAREFLLANGPQSSIFRIKRKTTTEDTNMFVIQVKQAGTPELLILRAEFTIKSLKDPPEVTYEGGFKILCPDTPTYKGIGLDDDDVKYFLRLLNAIKNWLGVLP